jgi:hypothetical protein
VTRGRMADDPFVRSPAGDLDFGYLPEYAARQIRRQSGPIRLLQDDLRHIEERHAREIKQDGFSSIAAFVHTIAQRYNAIRSGDRGSLFLVLESPKEKARCLVVRLNPSIGETGEDY